jgi:hypothetical protein
MAIHPDDDRLVIKRTTKAANWRGGRDRSSVSDLVRENIAKRRKTAAFSDCLALAESLLASDASGVAS